MMLFNKDYQSSHCTEQNWKKIMWLYLIYKRHLSVNWRDFEQNYTVPSVIL